VEARKRFRDDVIALGVLSQILKEIAEFAPPGAEDYIKYNLTVLTDAEKLIKTVDEYADKIEKEAQKAQKEWDRVFSHPGITADTGRRVVFILNSNKNATINKLPDVMEKRNSFLNLQLFVFGVIFIPDIKEILL
jgi:chemotaxis regulatin CheY-phosphate phosphatase CheZ